MNQPHEELFRSTLTANLERDIQTFRTILNSPDNSDAQFRFFDYGNSRVCILYIEGLSDDKKISEFVLHALADRDTSGIKEVTTKSLIENTIEIAQCKTESRVSEIIKSVTTGMSAVFVDGSEDCILMETRGYPARPVGKTTNESVVIGAQEGFVENLRTNITLMRRYLPSPHLITESLTIGTKIPTRVSLIYIEGVADESIVSEIRTRLKGIRAAFVQGIGAIQQLIEDDPYAILPQYLQTERPDRAASCLSDGQIIILADNSPYALIAPATLFHMVHASDDSYMRWQYGSFLRIIRTLGMLISVYLPGLYISLTAYHSHLIPMNLLTSIAQSRANVPFPIIIEVLIMEFSFYLINEAGTRIPQQIGSALGIVGALILGQAAVSASIISPILIIIIALTGLGNFVSPNYSFGQGLILYRLFIILCGALMGLYGICLASFGISVRLCSLKSAGIPFVAPIAPYKPHNPDIILRLPLWLQNKLMFYAKKDSWLSQRGNNP